VTRRKALRLESAGPLRNWKGPMTPKVVILCGGMGTRLREETEYRPKPLVEIGGRPILWHIMKGYGHHGFKDFVLCLGFKGEMIKQYFLNFELMNSDFTLRLGARNEPELHGSHSREDWSITFAETGREAMTGARVKRIEPYIREDNFMLTYGDGVGDIDITKLWAFHRAHGKIATVTGVRPISQFGELASENGLVKEFREKPKSPNEFVNGGFFVCQRKFFDYVEDDDRCVLEAEPLEKLVRDGELMTYMHSGYWHCMDTYRDFLALNEAWTKGAPWKIWQD
jgi:glucose-1-phosphate cytidylyltransferase